MSTFDGSTIARTWARKLEELFLLHPVVEREAVEVVALHLEGEANAWWFSHSSHTRVTSFSDFTQGLIRTFDGERLERKGLHHHGRRLVPALPQLWESNPLHQQLGQPLH